MNFLTIDRQAGGQSGEISIGQAGKAVEIWTLVADHGGYSTEDIRLSGIFDGVYATFHAQNPRLRLMPVQVEQDEENPAIFIATLTWTSDKLDPKEKEEAESNPLNRKARITVKTSHLKEVKHIDAMGNEKVNAAGDLFDPPVENNATFLVITIIKNVTFFEDWVFDYSDAVNSLPFDIKGRTIAKGCAWIASIELGEENTDGPVAYCEARIEMHVKKKRQHRSGESPSAVPDPWLTEVLNEGLMQKKAGKRQRIKVKDDDGKLVNAPAPVPLNSDGTVMDPVTLSSLKYLVFHDHDELDFNAISLLWSDA